MQGMLRVCSLLVLLLSTGFAQAGAPEIAGRISVVDGDTFRVGGHVVRLHGIDAPEADQRCGGAAEPMWNCGAWVTAQVRAQYQGAHTRCLQVDRDRYGRAVARCTVDGADVGRSLVLSGLAFAFRRYSMAYDLDEKAAAVAGRGLHGTGITSPAAFRKAGVATRRAQNTNAAPDGCVIKGNISAKGQRIYHLPGQAWYDRTRIHTARGERWFCSEAEARAAGWRKARR